MLNNIKAYKMRMLNLISRSTSETPNIFFINSLSANMFRLLYDLYPACFVAAM
jgi:hypothetical protein